MTDLSHQQRQFRFRAFHFCGDGMVESEKFCWGIELACMCGAIIMQSTGLKDKNGKEIFEGDIVTKDGKINAEVIWKAPRFCVKLKVPRQINTLEGYGFADGGIEIEERTAPLDGDCEIIGDIYESPELLK